MENSTTANPPATPHPVEILLVDDDPGDVQLAREALEEGKFSNHLHVVPDGEKALAFLRQEAGYENALRPDIVLLDLNMPRKNGREVLAELKADPALSDIPIAIITGTQLEADVLKAYNVNVDCYITKPIDVSQLMKMVRSIPNFRVSVVAISASQAGHG